MQQNYIICVDNNHCPLTNFEKRNLLHIWKQITTSRYDKVSWNKLLLPAFCFVLWKLPRVFGWFHLCQPHKYIYGHRCILCHHNVFNHNHLRERGWVGISPGTKVPFLIRICFWDLQELFIGRESWPRHGESQATKVKRRPLVKSFENLIRYRCPNSEPCRSLNPGPSDCDTSRYAK